jgi:hypothetical protein
MAQESAVSAIGKFTGNTVGEAAAFAAGLAVGPLLEPLLQALRNETWSIYPDRPVDPQSLASAVAERKPGFEKAAEEAALSGIGGPAFTALVDVLRNGPGIAEGLNLVRRGQLAPAEFATVLERAALEDQFISAFQAVGRNGLTFEQVPLDASVLANAIVRGVVAAPFPLPYVIDRTPGQVEPFPESQLDTAVEAEATGTSLERLFIQTAIAGRPMAPEEAATAVFRGIIDVSDYNRAIAEGDIRSEYRDAIFERARQILTAHDWVELRLRGWIDDGEMYAGTALHGMSQENTDLLFKVLGRPMSHRNVFLAQRRGGTYGVTPADIDPHFLKSLQESNERPEWYGLEWALRFSQPSVFVIRQYLKDGGDPAWARTKLYYEGWEDSDIDIFVKEYAKAGGTGTGAGAPDSHLKSAITSAITAIRKAYVGGSIDATQAASFQQQAEQATTLVEAWDVAKNVEALPASTAGPPPTGQALL